MWIVLRLILFVVGIGIRVCSRRRSGEYGGTFEGMSYQLALRKDKSSIQAFRIGAPRRSLTWIRFTREGSIDRLFKRMKMANEIQTGDAPFDASVYVACDHPNVERILLEERALRGAISRAFEGGFKWVQFDGTNVWLERESRTAPDDADLRVLADIQRTSRRLSEGIPSRLGDRFLWRAFTAEVIIWGIAGVAIGAVLEGRIQSEDYHVWMRQIVVRGADVLGRATFETRLGGAGPELGLAVIESSDGALIVVGHSRSYARNERVILARLEAS